MAEKRRKKSRDDDEDDDYGGEEEEYMPLDEVDEEEEEKSKRRGRKRKSEECRVQPKKAKSAARAKGKQKAKGSEEDEDEDYGVEAEEADTRPAKKARSPAKPKATTATKKGATPAPQPGGAKPTTSEDFFKRKDFVNHYYSAVWTLEKKAKDSKEKTTVTEEGCITIEWDRLTLLNMNGKPVGNAQLVRRAGEANDEEEGRVFILKGKKESEILFEPGQQLVVGTKQVQLVEPLSADEFKDGTFFLKQFSGHEIRQKAQQLAESPTKAAPLIRKIEGPRFRLAGARKPRPGTFRVPIKGEKTEEKKVTHNHDPDAPNALTLYRAPKFEKSKTSVVVDPILTKYLRPHQREGVQFLYNCITGQGGFKGNGAILADEMGLGKTLQSVTLLWTVLRQGIDGSPMVKKAMIIAPSSLVKNWYMEVHKWLGQDSLTMLAIGENKSKISSDLDDFKRSKVDLLIISYTQALRNIDVLCDTKELDLIICDEGHRLKNSEIKTTKALMKLKSKRKIILSGTPIQNDLEEFYSMIEFVNPGILGEREKFRKVFEEPIMAGRQPGATEKEKAIGDARSKMLSSLTSIFILRRTADILRKYLPPKVEYTVFCRLAPLQKAIYRAIVREKMKVALETGRRDDALSSITMLKKLCNHPSLVYSMCQKNPEANKATLEAFPAKFQALESNPQLSGKFLLLDSLLKEIRKRTKDRIVIVSNYTQISFSASPPSGFFFYYYSCFRRS